MGRCLRAPWLRVHILHTPSGKFGFEADRVVHSQRRYRQCRWGALVGEGGSKLFFRLDEMVSSHTVDILIYYILHWFYYINNNTGIRYYADTWYRHGPYGAFHEECFTQ